MKSEFDWSSFLSDREEVVWTGRMSRSKSLAILAAAMALMVWAWSQALGEVASSPGGSECFTDDCPKADSKAQLVLLIAPPTICFLALAMLAIPFIRNAYAVTTMRVLSRHEAPWRRSPKLGQVQVKGASARTIGTALYVLGREPGQRVALLAESRDELKRALATIERLSQEPNTATGLTL